MSAVITVENLSKAYRIGLKEEIPDTLMGAVASWLKAPLNGFRRLQRLDTSHTHADETDLVWALEDVSFEINQGEVVGIIGRNGAGKSTLLKILSRITEPTSGRATIRGRVSSLLEVGTGFHPELTGRENIYLNGTILGMKKREIDQKFDEIVDFSGVERFLDTPIKRYSSGMQVRLAFAVAAHLEPDILVIDEVLAVGDAEFQNKCLGKMQAVATTGRTVLFVSHNMPVMQSLCRRCMLLDAGRVELDGEAGPTIRFYLDQQATPTDESMTLANKAGVGTRVETFRMLDHDGTSRNSFEFSESFRIQLDISTQENIPNLHALVVLWRRSDGCRVSSFTTRELPIGPLEVGLTSLSLDVQPALLFPGEYYWSIQLLTKHRVYLHVDPALSLTIRPKLLDGAPAPYVTGHGVFHLATNCHARMPDGSERAYGFPQHPLPEPCTTLSREEVRSAE